MRGDLAVRAGAHGKAAFPRTDRPAIPRGGPRILILYASCGAGHQRAAEALELALRELCPSADLVRVDVLTLATRAFRHCYGQMYLDYANAASPVLGVAYSLMDTPGPAGVLTAGDRLRLGLELLNLPRFCGLLRSAPWDLIVNTHFLPGEIVGHLRRRKELAVPQVTVVTDFETHRLWITEPCERYFTATEEASLYLQAMGVPAERIAVHGIPVHPAFSKPRDRAACLAAHGLGGDRPVVLQLAGGYGVGRIEELFRALLDIEVPLELIAVTGHNEEARRQLKGLLPPPRHRVHVLGYTTQMNELMAAADLLVSKPGGLTTSEALARGLPLVVVDPIPGQEERNSDFLLEEGAALKVSHLPTLAEKLTPVLRDPERLAALRANARRLGRPRAAFAIAAACLALAGARHESACERRTAPGRPRPKRLSFAERWSDVLGLGPVRAFRQLLRAVTGVLMRRMGAGER